MSLSPELCPQEALSALPGCGGRGSALGGGRCSLALEGNAGLHGVGCHERQLLFTNMNLSSFQRILVSSGQRSLEQLLRRSGEEA